MSNVIDHSPSLVLISRRINLKVIYLAEHAYQELIGVPLQTNQQ